MPNRILKESICTSDDIDSLTPEQEVFFYRLMVVCDDYGLMDARPAILKAKCYPLKSIDFKCVQAMLSALQAIGLVTLYEVSGKTYLQITNWASHQQIRAKRAKYPLPSDGSAITCNQMQSDAPVNQSNPIQSESNPNPNPISRAARSDEINEVFDCWRQTMGHHRSALDDKRNKLITARLKDGYTVEQLCNAIRGCSLSPWHMGDNDNGRKYDGLDLILRDAAKVDQFIGFFESPPKKPVVQTKQINGRQAAISNYAAQAAAARGDVPTLAAIEGEAHRVA